MLFRSKKLEIWAQALLGDEIVIKVASADASFRRYFRVTYLEDKVEQSAILMDAPPELEDSRPFVSIAKSLRDCGVNAPEIHSIDFEQGFMLLSDLGSTPYLTQLNSDSADSLYGDAIAVLLTMQQDWPSSHKLPEYDRELLLREMELFPEWYLKQHLKIDISAELRSMLNQQFALLAESALEQPQVTVHRDYHSRNLMVVSSKVDGVNPGVIDFQDAVRGAITYDLVSLLRDSYIAWPRKQVESWVADYYAQLKHSGAVADIEWQQFLRWFDWMGVQRHIKVVGIFSRLNHRDEKPSYLADIPLTLNYIKDVTSRYRELAPLYDLVSSLK